MPNSGGDALNFNSGECLLQAIYIIIIISIYYIYIIIIPHKSITLPLFFGPFSDKYIAWSRYIITDNVVEDGGDGCIAMNNNAFGLISNNILRRCSLGVGAGDSTPNMMDFCCQNDGFRTQNDGFRAQNDGFCTQIDE